MTRKSAGAHGGMSLFPYLAVLICTMGALIVLLVCVSRQARLQAAEEARNGTHASPAKGDSQDDAERRRKQQALQAARDEATAALEDDRLRLATAEQSLRSLEDRLRELRSAMESMQRTKTGQAQDVASRQAELDRLKAEIDEARRHLEEDRAAVAQRPRSYAVIPYEGPNQTRRRPLYIECRSDTVILQPEGVTLAAHDFVAPEWEGNPLAAAMRAAGEYLKSQPETATSEPYPLLLVRPDGIEAYYIARHALAAWGSDFGYELIGGDWPLKFPPADPGLNQAEWRAVNESRRLLPALVAAMPRQAKKAAPQFRVSQSTGGLVRDGGPSLSDAFGTDDADEPRTPFGQAFERAKEGGGQPQSAGAGNGPAFPNPQLTAQQGSTDGMRPSANSPPPGTGNAAVQSGPGTAGMQRDPGNVASQPGSSIAAAQQGPGIAAAQRQPSGFQPAPDLLAAKAAPGSSKTSLAQSRGRNWGLSGAGPKASPVVRPVRIECQGDRLIVLGDRGASQRQVVMLRGRTEDAVDELVAVIHDHMRQWGIAGENMYWKPELVLEVGGGGEGRFADLQSLLKDSGFELRRSTP